VSHRSTSEGVAAETGKGQSDSYALEQIWYLCAQEMKK